jgi:hypothetical protein
VTGILETEHDGARQRGSERVIRFTERSLLCWGVGKGSVMRRGVDEMPRTGVRTVDACVTGDMAEPGSDVFTLSYMGYHLWRHRRGVLKG